MASTYISVVDSNGHTAQEDAEGEQVWNSLQNQEVECEQLVDSDFGALGEYVMGQLAGSSHEAMNDMSIQMMGEEGEQRMHIAMGKRISSCDPNAPLPQKFNR